MNEELRACIEEIRSGKIPQGFKKVKKEIVPLDWEEIALSEHIVEYSEKTTVPNQYPVLTSARTGLMLQTDYYSNRQVTTEDNVGYNVIPYGCITFRSRSDDGRFRFNKNTIIKKGIVSYFYPVFSFNTDVSEPFMIQLLNATIYKKMYPYAEGTAQQVLSLKKLGQLKYYIPCLFEQQEIATILVTQDRIIELKEKLIIEKQQQKKYLIRQLLSGKKRLQGFTEK